MHLLISPPVTWKWLWQQLLRHHPNQEIPDATQTKQRQAVQNILYWQLSLNLLRFLSWVRDISMSQSVWFHFIIAHFRLNLSNSLKTIPCLIFFITIFKDINSSSSSSWTCIAFISRTNKQMSDDDDDDAMTFMMTSDTSSGNLSENIWDFASYPKLVLLLTTDKKNQQRTFTKNDRDLASRKSKYIYCTCISKS